MKKEINNILIQRHFLFTDGVKDKDKERNAYYNAYLLSTFGIVVDKPQLLTKEIVKDISQFYKLTIPESFYFNPQDTRYYTQEELLIEQFVSYFSVEHPEVSMESLGYTEAQRFKHLEIFKKDLPQYVFGDELHLREFRIVTQAEADTILRNIVEAFCSYTRPFSFDELNEFVTLYLEGYYDNQHICCKDNIFSLLEYNISFASGLDMKDLVKLSIMYFGESSNIFRLSKLERHRKEMDILRGALQYVNKCPLSKKQAKYYNKITEILGCNCDMTNANSPYRLANEYIEQGDVLSAAKIFAENGSLLQRNLRFLLSRANPQESITILEMLPDNNPIVLYQLLSTLCKDDMKARQFRYYTADKTVKNYMETEYEARWRKSRLNESTKQLLREYLINKINSHYNSKKDERKVYINDNFYKIALPINTSTSGKGIDTLPTGSRIKIESDFIRTFTYWKHIYDVDASIAVTRDEDFSTYESFYFGYLPHGDNGIWFSGDCRDEEGSEYFDLDLNMLKQQGYKYVILGINGYQKSFDNCEVKCGYQCKDNLDSIAWDPKNIAMQFSIKGNSHFCLGIAVDIMNNEIIVLNQLVDSFSRVVRLGDVKSCLRYLSSEALDIFNVGKIAALIHNQVDNPNEADIVFDDKYHPKKGQEVIRSWEQEKLVKLL